VGGRRHRIRSSTRTSTGACSKVREAETFKPQPPHGRAAGSGLQRGTARPPARDGERSSVDGPSTTRMATGPSMRAPSSFWGSSARTSMVRTRRRGRRATRMGVERDRSLIRPRPRSGTCSRSTPAHRRDAVGRLLLPLCGAYLAVRSGVRAMRGHAGTDLLPAARPTRGAGSGPGPLTPRCPVRRLRG
jgi:hypothetical protein